MGHFSDSEIAAFPKIFLHLISYIVPKPCHKITLQGEGPGPASPYWREKGEHAKPRCKLHPKVAYELFCNLESIFSQKQIYIAWLDLRVTHKAFYLGYFSTFRLFKTSTSFILFWGIPHMRSLGVDSGCTKSQQKPASPHLPLPASLAAKAMAYPWARSSDLGSGTKKHKNTGWWQFICDRAVSCREGNVLASRKLSCVLLL